MSLHGFNDYQDDPADRDNNDVEAQRQRQGGMMGSFGGAGVLACGEKVNVGTLSCYQYPLLCCCPCCLGPPCSHNRRTNYKNMLKTFCSLIFFVCWIMFIVELSYGNLAPAGIAPTKYNPMIGPYSVTLAELGSSYGYRTQNYYEVWRFFSPIFLHGGFIHIIMNMLFLIMIGVMYEQKWKWKRMAIIFLFSGLGANMFSSCANPNQIAVGASTSLFGILGAALADLLIHWSNLDPNQRKMMLFQQVFTILIWMLISWRSEVIDLYGHLGGLIFGILVGGAIWAPEHGNVLMKKFGRAFFVLVSLGLVFLFLGLFFGRVITTHCVFGANGDCIY